MAMRKNKAIDVEINVISQGVSEVKINKHILGTIDERENTIRVQVGQNKQQIVKNFDEGVEILIAEYNLHH
ncbi:DUF2969 domain-containing protein [Weissella diestrammenae]|uniref:DUF2969 domain-containing protein n=1 Tax=Weissella diestrammenae TaxID=1162633 RepID=A0A7G9T6J1_9LACO|nr:DUF2969 family protein [Weissella diestrammenae]MCM0583228.1 DUF2969 domain-containing protein [Weissella diestrammenae]QNN75716.1 DUF2969 domain-containing protein [Weissella diestrammenae]